jgi:hypothetical protein
MSELGSMLRLQNYRQAAAGAVSDQAACDACVLIAPGEAKE